MWSIHRGQKSKHITPTPKRPPLGTPPAAARQLNAQRSGFIVGACCRAQRIFHLNDCRWQSYLDSLIDRPQLSLCMMICFFYKFKFSSLQMTFYLL